MASWQGGVQLTECDLNRNGLIGGIECTEIGRAVVGVCNADVEVSLGSPVCKCLAPGAVSSRAHKELIASVRYSEGIFAGWTQDRVRRISGKSHPPIGTRRYGRHIGNLHRHN